MRYIKWIMLALLILVFGGDKIVALISTAPGVLAVAGIVIVSVVAIAIGAGMTVSHNAFGKNSKVEHHVHKEYNFFGDDDGAIKWIRGGKDD